MARRDWSEELRASLVGLPDREPELDHWPSIENEIRGSDSRPTDRRRRAWLAAAVVAGFALALSFIWLANRSNVGDVEPSRRAEQATAGDRRLLLFEEALEETAAALELESEDAYLREHLVRLEQRRERYLRAAARWGMDL